MQIKNDKESNLALQARNMLNNHKIKCEVCIQISVKTKDSPEYHALIIISR